MSNPYVTSEPKINRRMTHKARLLIYLRARQPKWIIKGELENQAVEWGCFADTLARRLRELTNEGRIEVKRIDGVTHYRLTQSEPYNPINSYIQKIDKIDNERQRSLL